MRLPYILALLLLFPMLTGCSITHAMRVEDREVIEIKTMIDELKDTQVVFVGERHNEPKHHALQFEILKALVADGKKVAIGMEMFEEASQRALDAWSTGKAPEFAIRKVYENNWRNIPWRLYSDILLYARDNRIPIVALNAPRDVVQAVARFGFASLSSDHLKKLPPDIDANARESDLELMRSYATHGKSGEGFKNLAEAQLLRNMVMGRRIGDYLEKNPDRVMVVIAGGGHARGTNAVPAEMRKDIGYRIVLPPLPPITHETVTTKDADYLLMESY